MTRVALIVLAMSTAACARSSSRDGRAGAARPHASETTAPAAIRIDSVAGARAAIGKRVRVEGSGGDAKLGAVVVTGDLVVYCTDREAGWDVREGPVIVEGVLEESDHAEARAGRDGSVSAGTGGPIFQMACELVR